MRWPTAVGLAIAGLLAAAPGCRQEGRGDNAAAGKTVLVFAAASTANAIGDIKAEFAKNTGIKVETSLASSATLAQQIVHGADADVFLSADEKWADYLAEKDLVAARRDLLSNRLVVVVPRDSALTNRKLEDLLSPAVEHVALGDPSSVPAGIYAQAALAKLGLWDKLRAKVVSGEDVRHALAFVESGAAEAGIVYATDAAISQKVVVAVQIPEELTGPIRYPVVLLKRPTANPAAESFFRYLAAPEAAKVFEKYGFTVLGPPDAQHP